MYVIAIFIIIAGISAFVCWLMPTKKVICENAGLIGVVACIFIGAFYLADSSTSESEYTQIIKDYESGKYEMELYNVYKDSVCVRTDTIIIKKF